MNWKQELIKRKEGMFWGSVIGLGLFYFLKTTEPVQTQSVINMAVANPTMVSSVLTPEWRIMLSFIIIGLIIGMWVDNK